MPHLEREVSTYCIYAFARPVREDEDVEPLSACLLHQQTPLCLDGLVQGLVCLAACSRGAFALWMRFLACLRTTVGRVTTCPVPATATQAPSPLFLLTFTASYSHTSMHRPDDRSTGIAAGRQADKARHHLYYYHGTINDKDEDDAHARPSAAISASAPNLA